jgi:hypothetical protein
MAPGEPGVLEFEVISAAPLALMLRFCLSKLKFCRSGMLRIQTTHHPDHHWEAHALLSQEGENKVCNTCNQRT